MQILFAALAVLHTILAFGIVVGLKARDLRRVSGVPAALVWAARGQLLLGLTLVGLAEGALGESLDHAKVAVKLLLALGVVGCLEVGRVRARRGAVVESLVAGAFVLAVSAILVAVLWA